MAFLVKKLIVGIIVIINFISVVAGSLYAFDDEKPILIISSYNPETSSTANNIQALQYACDSMGIKNPIIIENMNCKNFSEAKMWKSRFASIISKYRNGDGVLNLDALVLLGQESWASYLSQDIDDVENVPVVVGMASSNGLILPGKDMELDTWAPAPFYLSDLYKRKNIISGIAYKYNISENLKMAKRFFPDLKKIALLTDNTFGGVVLQAHVKAELAKDKGVELILLDGRSYDISEIIHRISALDASNTVLFLGTWRVDRKESYFLSSSLYTMMNANRELPAFSLSTIGLGDWAIGGVVPDYRNQGKNLALRLKKVLENNSPNYCVFDFIPNIAKYDIKKVREFNLDESIARSGVVINDDKSIMDKYPKLIYLIITTLSVLIVAFIMVSYFLYKTRKLNMSLTMSEDNNRLILNNIGVGLLFIDKNFKVLWENCSVTEGMESWTFLKVGAKCYDSKHDGKFMCKNCPALKFKTGESTVKTEIIERMGKRVFSLSYIPVFSRGEEYIGFVLRIEDVTLREKINVELYAAKEAAENADKLKSQFLANMSHEIRTPLNAIVGFSELLADLEDHDEKKEFVKIIEANNKQLLQLINDILDLSKIEAGTLEFHMEQVYMSKVIEEIYQIFLPQCSAKGLELIKDVPAEEYCLISDKNRIAQVISNFMTNSLKFTCSGYIKLGFKERENDIKIYVEDTGMGISDEKRSAVFERFVKLNSFAQGTGLGLSICMMIVNRLGGSIDVESEEGRGSVFWFTIPKNNASHF